MKSNFKLIVEVVMGLPEIIYPRDIDRQGHWKVELYSLVHN